MALYHKHRPQTFATMIGQEHIVQTLKNQLIVGKMAHAYLFTGPRGVGKTTAARLVAKALNCRARKPDSAEPCDECDSCQEIRGSRAIDVLEVDAASQTGVDNVRDNIIANAESKPTKSPYKVFIIDEAHMLSTASFNALLKTLEEPPSYVVFILATTEAQKLPETIISRCQRFDFRRLPFDAMAKHISAIAKDEGVVVDESVIERVVQKSDGCVRDAVSLLDQLTSSGERHITEASASVMIPMGNRDEILNLVSLLVDMNGAGALACLEKLVLDGAYAKDIATDLLELVRVMLIINLGADPSRLMYDMESEASKKIKKLAVASKSNDILRLADLILRRRADIKSSPAPELPLELMIIEWCEESQKSIDASSAPEAQAPINQAAPEIKTSVKNNIPLAEKSQSKAKTAPLTEALPAKANQDASDPICTKEEAEQHWNSCMKQFEADTPSLATMLKTAVVDGIIGNCIAVTVPYNFHRDKLMSAVYYQKLQTALSSLLGASVTVRINVSETPERAKADLQTIAAAFGGEILE